MSASNPNPSEALLQHVQAVTNNNDASIANQNVAAAVKEASNPAKNESENIVIPDPHDGSKQKPGPETYLTPKSPPPNEVPTYNYVPSSDKEVLKSPVYVLDTDVNTSAVKTSEPEVLLKSILRPKTDHDGPVLNHDDVDQAPRTDSNSDPAPLPRRSIKYSSGSITTSQTKKTSESGSLSKIPVPVSTMKISGRKKKRKNSITKVAGANHLSECIYKAMISCSGETDDSSPNMSDGYIDQIIQQSSKKSTDRGLDSSGDFLDDSEDVFEEEERRKEACDNIVIKFLELTGDKGNSSNLSPAMCVSRHESRGATPVLNLKSNFLKCGQVGISRSTYDEDSLHSEQELRSLENKVSLYERRIDSLEDQLVVAKGAAEEKDLKCDQMWRDLKALEVDPHSSNTSENVGDKAESSQIEMVVKGLENKLNLYESKIEALEDRLKVVKSLAEDKDLQCEELRREVNVLVSRPEQKFHQVDGKDSSQVEHVVKGLENKISLYENKIDSLEDQLKISKVSIEDKDKTCEDLTRDLRVTESERLNLEAKTKDMEVEVHVKKTKIDDLDEELRTLKAKYSQLELELNEESNKVESLENKRKDSDLLITGYEIEVNSLQSKLEMCDDENTKLKDDLKIKSEVIDKKSSEVEESNRRMEVLESDINKFETAYQDANMRLIKSDQENQESHVKIRDFETNVKELEREIHAFNKQSSKIEEKMKEMENDQFKNKRAMFEKPAEKIDLSCKKCENLEKKLKTVQSKFEMAEEQLKGLLEKHDVINEVNIELKSEIDMSLNKNETLIAEYKAKEVDIIGKEREIFGLKNKMIALENDVQKFETNLKTTNGKLDALAVNGEDSDRNLNVAKVNMAKMEEAMEAFKDENDKLKLANKLLGEDFKVHTGLVQAADSTLSKCEAVLEATKKDFDTNCQELKIAMDELNSIKAAKQDIDAKYDKLVDEHENIRFKLSEVESKSEECERTVVKLEKENEKLFTDWTAEKAKNQTVVQGLEDEVSQLMML